MHFAVGCGAAMGIALLVAALGLPVRAWAAPGAPDPGAPGAGRPTRHALIIGIGEYLDPAIPELPGVVHDMDSAREMAHAMGVPDDQISVLRDHDATAEGIRAAIDALGSRVRDGDRVFVYYSGHGTRWHELHADSQTCTEGLLAADGVALTNVEMGERLAPLARQADKMLVFYDACFSGGVAGAPFRTRSLRLGGDRITPKFSQVGAPQACSQPSNFRSRGLAQVMQQARALPENVVEIAASRPDEVSFDSSLIGGFATASWRDCLLGEARDADGSGAVTADEVTACAQSKVDAALAGQPGILGQRMTVVGNHSFVPAWHETAAPPRPASAPMPPAVAAASPAQILAELNRQRDGSRAVIASVRQSSLRIGRDTLQIDVTPAHDGNLYVALAAADGHSLYLLYPNELATDNRVHAGQRVSLPGPGWEIAADGPPGPETLLVMVTDAPRDLGTLERERDGPFMKTLLDSRGRARLQWVLSNGTPTAGCGARGAPSCSDAFGAALLQIETVP